MITKKYKSEIVSILKPFEGIYTLEFRSLAGRYKYHPGQFLHLAFDPNYDGTTQWPESRCFSMQSNPDEETIHITYAVKGNFTQHMAANLKVLDEVWLKLPYGDLFTQPHSKENTVFIAGGTGITPFLSLFTHKSFDEYTNPKIYLGFRSKVFDIYQDVFNNSSKSNLYLKSYYQDEVGIIDIDQIFDENGLKSTYFISGPPQMITTFKQTLISKGVPISQVLTDDWE